MAELLYGGFYLAVLLIVVGAAVYLFLTRQRGASPETESASESGSVGDLRKYIAQLASSATGSCLGAELARTGDTLMATKDDGGVNLQFDRRSSIEDFVPKLERLAGKEGLVLLSHDLSFPEVTIPPSRASPESIAHRLFCGIYDAKDEEAVSFTLILEGQAAAR